MKLVHKIGGGYLLKELVMPPQNADPGNNLTNMVKETFLK